MWKNTMIQVIKDIYNALVQSKLDQARAHHRMGIRARL